MLYPFDRVSGCRFFFLGSVGGPGREERVRTQTKDRFLYRYRLELVNGSSRGNSSYVGIEYGEFNNTELHLWPGRFGKSWKSSIGCVCATRSIHPVQNISGD